MAGPFSRFSLMMQVVTDPTNRTDAIPHQGGWTEQHCWPGLIPGDGPAVQALATARAALLPAQASIVGVRRSVFTTVGNRIVSSGSQTYGVTRVGGTAITDLPQVSLSLNVASEGGGNASRQILRCIPDVFMTRGEFQPTVAYKSLLSLYLAQLVDANWAFMGRNIASPVMNVFSIAANVITLQGEGLAAVGESIRLLKVVDAVTEKPISGSFRVTLVDGAKYTVAGLPQGATSLNSGLARKDEIILCNIGTAVWNRAVMRKIGRPFEAYRGRASRVRR